MLDTEYQCDLCERVFTKGVSDEEAKKELYQYWPETSIEECAMVCDDCWQKIEKPNA